MNVCTPAALGTTARIACDAAAKCSPLHPLYASTLPARHRPVNPVILLRGASKSPPPTSLAVFLAITSATWLVSVSLPALDET